MILVGRVKKILIISDVVICSPYHNKIGDQGKLSYSPDRDKLSGTGWVYLKEIGR